MAHTLVRDFEDGSEYFANVLMGEIVTLWNTRGDIDMHRLEHLLQEAENLSDHLNELLYDIDRDEITRNMLYRDERLSFERMDILREEITREFLQNQDDLNEMNIQPDVVEHTSRHFHDRSAAGALSKPKAKPKPNSHRKPKTHKLKTKRKVKTK